LQETIAQALLTITAHDAQGGLRIVASAQIRTKTSKTTDQNDHFFVTFWLLSSYQLSTASVVANEQLVLQRVGHNPWGNNAHESL
jgi:hypothetical protein